MATEARAIKAGSKGPEPDEGSAVSLPIGLVAQTMPTRPSLAEHPLVDRVHSESLRGAGMREKPLILLHKCSHPLPSPSVSFLSREQRHTNRL